MCPVDVLSFSGGGAFLVGNGKTPDTIIKDQDGEPVARQLGPKEGHFVKFPLLELMQFTGLFDKNGEEIYEGDVVEYADGLSNRVEVGWSKALAGFSIFAGDYYSHDPKNMEVIGNIYQNPEFLKV